MQYIYPIIKADYLQRTRSYSFLITLAITIFMAYSFIPANSANYTTLSALGYKGVYNSAWVGYVSGIMTTVMLSIYGFLLVNSGIKKDINTEVGLIVATTPITNFKYLLSKQLSNYIVLLTIAGITFIVSIGVFFMRGTGYPFILGNFIFPYLFFAVPALFVVASLAVAGEVFLGRRSILQFIAYFFLVGICMGLINAKSDDQPTGIFDPFGLSLITKSITQHINSHFNEDLKGVSFGFIFNGRSAYKTFTWEGLNWSALFIFSRLLWMGLGLGVVYISSLFFHRFDSKQADPKRKTKEVAAIQTDQPIEQHAGISRAVLPPLVFDYGIFPLVRTELFMLIRQGKKWLWLVNAALWVAMFIVPFNIAHNYLLPVLLFLQVTRWSELVTKEKTNRVHYFSFASYKPLQRMLPAQILSGVLLSIGLSLPLIIRGALTFNSDVVLSIINGAVLIVLLAVAFGILTGGKKLFEVFFFLLTYSVVNKVPVTDYLGSLPHQDMSFFMLVILGINTVLVIVSFMIRRYQTRHS
ncbi:hypothetical protein [Pedobacter metabolipauper]|uniref:ABC-2 type transport system permease protein n=1 Tax=Pedobacter metabolipauper TaxID=425513 RepID=A0A4V3D0Q6_9SPHI|nr:hypothetical protein [Pedobacter metabolipauper]TDQ06958.1 hypothetical protein ATK78_3973 [Pedobacter metabolipauper]